MPFPMSDATPSPRLDALELWTRQIDARVTKIEAAREASNKSKIALAQTRQQTWARWGILAGILSALAAILAVSFSILNHPPQIGKTDAMRTDIPAYQAPVQPPQTNLDGTGR